MKKNPYYEGGDLDEENGRRYTSSRYTETKYTGRKGQAEEVGRKMNRRIRTGEADGRYAGTSGNGQPDESEADWYASDEDEEDVRDRDYDEYDTRDMPEDEDRSRRSSGSGRPPRKRARKRHHPVRNILWILLILILVLAGMFLNVARKFNHIDTEVSKNRGSLGKQINILLIGQDAREGQEQQRSDSMILLTVNQTNQTVILTSFMRDMYVEIPGYGSNRINAAYAYGGIDLLDQTIEQDFGVEIDGNAMVDLQGFLEAMTAVGDLKIDLTADEAAYMNANPALGTDTDDNDPAQQPVWNLTEGENSLNAQQILCYSRMRHVGNSDWDRTKRQRNVIMAAVNKVKHGHLIGGYRMASRAAGYITTDTSTWQMLGIAFSILRNKDMQSYQIPVDGTYQSTYVDGMAVLVPDMDQQRKYLQEYMSGEYQKNSTGTEE